jgi:hypothetical protein
VGIFDARWELFKREVEGQLVDEMSAQSPVGDPLNDPAPGTLAASHSSRDGDGGRLEIVSTDARGPIARFVIRGTQAHPIEPVSARALHFFVDGDEVFTKHVEHPGTSPNPYNRVAWEAQRPDVVHRFAVTVGRGYALSVLNPWRNRKI